MSVTVAIPSIPPRADMLARAVQSASVQTRPPERISIAFDTHRDGAAVTRNRAWQAADTTYVAFLDDDDELLPQHVERLLHVARLYAADFVYPWFEVIGGTDPFPHHFGKDWTRGEPHQTTVTGLWRLTALEKIGGFPEAGDGVDREGNRVGEDFMAVARLDEMGGRIVHLPERTWRWHHHSSNTSGMPDRW